MTTIPLKDDGSPDWGRVGPEETYAANLIARAAYIAGLERCAQWHGEQAAIALEQQTFETVGYHNEAATKIRQWIEKEKQSWLKFVHG